MAADQQPPRRVVKKIVVRPPTTPPPRRPERRFRERLGTAGSAVSGQARRAGRSGVAGLRAVVAWRVPHLSAVPAALAAGLAAGLVAVALTSGAKLLFDAVRGTSTGGGGWGSLTLVVVAFATFAVGELLLSALGSHQPRLTSFLGVVLGLIAILAFFLGLVDSGWAWLLVPVLAAATYLVASLALALAATTSVTD